VWVYIVLIAMSIVDRVRRRFASIGSNPPFKKDDPVSYGEGIIKRIRLTNNKFQALGKGEYEPHIGQPRTYMNVYLSDPIVRSLIDLPCLYAVKDGFDIVTDDTDLREEISKMFIDINIASSK